ncbi:MAG TPA: DUF2127 domain-containing protein [Ktedonobacteraceae bacterium]
MKTSRPLVLALATVFLVLIGLGSLVTPLLVGPPVAVIVLSVVMGLLGLVAAHGLWNRKRWGMIVAIVVSAISAISGILACSFFRSVGIGLKEHRSGSKPSVC